MNTRLFLIRNDLTPSKIVVRAENVNEAFQKASDFSGFSKNRLALISGPDKKERETFEKENISDCCWIK
jgi:hypothetical protein